MTAITQLQMSYNAEEDRLLLRVNTSARDEFRFWLTRRYVTLLLKALKVHRAADPDVSTQPTPDAKKAIQEFKQEAAQSSGNFEDEFKASDSFPLGEMPVVAHKLSYKVDNGKLVLTISPKTGAGITVTLDAQLNFNVGKLLRASNESAGWRLDIDELEPSTPEGRVIN
jgi:hypothetical protein